MTQIKLKVEERTLRLADRLLDDIHNRQLQTGDAYMTTVEVADFLGVSGSVANRVLRHLESREVLFRAQRKGSVILKTEFDEPKVKHVHLLNNARFPFPEQYHEDHIAGIRDILPFSYLTCSSLDSKNEVEIIRGLLEDAKNSGEVHGFIMRSSSPVIQDMLGRSGFPCVSLGTRCPGIPAFSYLDIDYNGMLRLLYQYLCQMKKSKTTLMLRRVMMPGDNSALNIAMRMGIANCFFIQHKENEPELVDEICELIQTRFTPDSFICLTNLYADKVAEALQRLGRDPDETEITVMFPSRFEAKPTWTHVVPQMSPRETGARLAQLLIDSAMGVPPRSAQIPVRLVCRSGVVWDEVDRYGLDAPDLEQYKSLYNSTWAFYN